MPTDDEHKPPLAEQTSAPPKTFVTNTTLGNPELTIECVAGWLRLLDGPQERERAEVFYTYYKSTTPGVDRPVTFVCNGGPGASSAFLHLGALGPFRARFNPNGTLPKAPARLVENPETWLAFTDLVFIDPIGTGLSRSIDKKPTSTTSEPRAGEPAEDPHYWNVDNDLRSICDFFERFLSIHHRWSSPVFLAGESYGGYRVARLARMAQEKAGIGLSGCFLISPALEWEMLLAPFGRVDALGFATLLPSLVAGAQAQGKAFQQVGFKGKHFETIRDEVERFALKEALPAIASAAISEDGLDSDVAQRLAELTGLPLDFVAARGGRIGMDAFARELLRGEGKIVGLYDACISADNPLPNDPVFSGLDPTLMGQQRLFATTTNTLLREKLGVDDSRKYHLLNFDVHFKWRHGPGDGSPLPPGATEDLLAGMAANPDMRVVISHGYHDLVTPYFVSDYIVGLMRHESSTARRIELKHFDGGHMFYSRDESRRAFTEMARTMVEQALAK